MVVEDLDYVAAVDTSFVVVVLDQLLRLIALISKKIHIKNSYFHFFFNFYN